MSYRRGEVLSGPHRVVVTGAGIVTSMGYGWQENAIGFREGRTALRPITVFDSSRQRVHTGGEVLMDQPLPTVRLTARQISRLDRATLLLLHAGTEAMKQAGWSEDQMTDVPICLGTSAGAMSLGECYYKQKTQQAGSRRGLAKWVLGYQPQTQAQHLAEAVGLKGPVSVITNACASGANAIGHGFHLIKGGRARRAFCGGYDAIAEMVFAGFDSLQALSTTTPRPFAADRDGLALGEGAALVTLERLDDALARGATILGEVTGYGTSTDLHHLTQPHPQGDAALRSMNEACAEAGIGPESVGYINSHGTGTPLNDIAEGSAIRRWAGDHASNMCVSSTKGAIGHLLGGAGSVEAVICLMALQGGWIPPNVPIPVLDPVVNFDLVQSPRDRLFEHALTNSFGFGGSNATLILRRAHCS
jgi:3-oxoacyl-[acyl-carrier-protein] synthase II